MNQDEKTQEAHRVMEYLEAERDLNVIEGIDVLLLAIEAMAHGLHQKTLNGGR